MLQPGDVITCGACGAPAYRALQGLKEGEALHAHPLTRRDGRIIHFNEALRCEDCGAWCQGIDVERKTTVGIVRKEPAR